MTTRDFGFQDSMLFAEGASLRSDVRDILLGAVPAAVAVDKSHVTDDRRGIDFWVFRAAARPLGVDLKARRIDPLTDLTPPKDDLALELWSVIERKTLGWTLDTDKESDYILWLFESTRRWVLMPFPMLCAVFQKHHIDWAAKYKTVRQSSNGGRWHSECIFVPQQVIWQAMYDRFGG